MCPTATKTLGNAKSPPYCKVLACFLLERSKVLASAKGRLKEIYASLSSQANWVRLVGRSVVDFLSSPESTAIVTWIKAEEERQSWMVQVERKLLKQVRRLQLGVGVWCEMSTTWTRCPVLFRCGCEGGGGCIIIIPSKSWKETTCFCLSFSVVVFCFVLFLAACTRCSVSLTLSLDVLKAFMVLLL